MTEEQIQWLRENLFLDVKFHGWNGGLDIEIRLGDEVFTSEHIASYELRDAAGVEAL
ncbi:hypothetical protein KNT87_gp075 [Erwinia phage Cronus]|uniref:Uncharacterized protein n=1 Tax=Erwinia phage Cronus TaxID=2163633 RepID=A0A2S1GMB2_9CAUD|nr:hypothetical protein KNT87_gp075 [Erwinia phage Cronus]AWD90514.1 hypothetical protein [Erwinia phage Cronus]